MKFLYNYTFGLLRKLYDWVLSLANKKYANCALFTLAFAESSFFPVPPDVLQIALSISKPKKSFFYALISTAGSVIGGIFGYFIGLFLFETIGRAIIEFFHYQEYFQIVGSYYSKYAFLAILGAAFTPIPYKVFTIAAGVWDVGLEILIIASILGRGGRFFLVATLIYLFGRRVRELIDRYFNIFTILVFLLVVGGFLILKYLI